MVFVVEAVRDTRHVVKDWDVSIPYCLQCRAAQCSASVTEPNASLQHRAHTVYTDSASFYASQGLYYTVSQKNCTLFVSSITLSKVDRFLRASAMLKHVIDIGWTSVRLSVSPSLRLSVCLSHAGTLSKRLNILSCFLHHTIAHSF